MTKQNQENVTVEMFTTAMERIFGQFEKIDARFDAIDRRIDHLESKMITDFRSLEEKMMHGFEVFDGRITTLETSVNRSIKTLSSQIQNLALTKADWSEEI